MVKLDAVNYLLGVLGSAPVGSLSSTNPDVSISGDALDRAVVSVTSNGFWFNTVYGVTISPDPVTSKIDSSGYTKIITRAPQYAVARNSFMFDPINNTYEFSESLTVDAVAILDFDDLPDNVQHAVMFFAAVDLCINELEDATKENSQQKLYNNAFGQIIKEDLEIKRRNMQQTPRVRQAMTRVFPARGIRRYGPNFGGR